MLPVSVPNSHLEDQPQEQPQAEVYEEVGQPMAEESAEAAPQPVMNGDEVDLRNGNECEMVASEEVMSVCHSKIVYHWEVVTVSSKGEHLIWLEAEITAMCCDWLFPFVYFF